MGNMKRNTNGSYNRALADSIKAFTDNMLQMADATVRPFYPRPIKVIYDKKFGVTVVLWADGTKTIVRSIQGEAHDAYHGYCVALAKKIHGSNNALKKDLEKVLTIRDGC